LRATATSLAFSWWRTTPRLFLTGETAPERVAAGFSAGATTYLLKPIDLELLDEELERALSEAPA
jgi:DNA-binding response OmpR family regulator